MNALIFPYWTNYLRPLVPPGIVVAATYIAAMVYFGGSPYTLDVGYAPVQPVPYSHALHAGQLGIDCRYCHTTVEKAAFAAVPPTATCMGCHANVRTNSPQLVAVRESYASASPEKPEGSPIHWVKVHDLPEFVYFNHSAHVTRGVGCKSCHGRVDKMDVVSQQEPLSMAWCLECHRQPELHLRPVDQVTNMAYQLEPRKQLEEGARLKEAFGINPPTSCSTCHR
ncbi:MAG TPA: cytochrome c3 family protein [Pirellulales bacterium]